MHYSLHNYSADDLFAQLHQHTGIAVGLLKERGLLKYIDSYLTRLEAKTLLIEFYYVDRDYIEDFAGYYVRCFNKYDRVCARFHFFSRSISQSSFEKILAGSHDELTQKELAQSYIGFLVVKKLPQTIIGRTCLKTYPQGEDREYPIVRKYDINLFGINLTVDSLAFQEQDRVAAACATSALWSVFNGTCKLFHHPMMSPVEITRAATGLVPIESFAASDYRRSFPNHGLTIPQMSVAIRSLGLEPLVIKHGAIDRLKAALYAYLRAKIPALFVIRLVEEGNNGKPLGLHAVAVTGFHLATAKVLDAGAYSEISSKIDKLYVHDDQIGPFARMEFEDSRLTTSWTGKTGKEAVYAEPIALIVPVYHKIRIPQLLIREIAYSFHLFLEMLGQANKKPAPSIGWDIHLTTVNEFKAELLRQNVQESTVPVEIFLTPMPKFLWIIEAATTDEKLFTFLLDATDIEQGSYLVAAIEYNKPLAALIRVAVLNSWVRQKFFAEPAWKILAYFSPSAAI